MAATSPKRFQVLALSGGGYRGLFGAEFLTACEMEYAAQCSVRFDVIAGTSIGALLAAGLSASISASVLSEAMQEHGPKIFNRKLTTSAKRIFIAAPYETMPVRDAIRDTLGKELAATLLSEWDAPLVITAVNYSTSETCVFRSKGVAGHAADEIAIEDAILASAAAPTFFPTMKIGPAEYIDGGLVANAPDMVALLEAINSCHARLDEIHQLSIGTASRREGAAVHSRARAPGSISWTARKGLIQSIMAAQEHLALTQAEQLLQKRFCRIDEEPAQNQVSAIEALDRASTKATDTLKLLAGRAWTTNKNSRQLRDFFVR